MSAAVTDAEIVSLVARCVGFDPDVATGGELDAHAQVLRRVGSWVDARCALVGAAKRRLEDAAADAAGRAGGSSRPGPSRRRARPAGPGAGSGAQARREQDAAEGARRCPSFADAVAEGRVSLDHLAAVGRVRNAADASGCEVDLLGAAVVRGADEFATWLRAWDDACDTARGEDLAARRRVKRRVTFGVDDDGMQVTRAVLGPVEHAKVSQALHHAADALWHNGDRTSSLPQRLADALVALITGEHAAAAPGNTPAPTDEPTADRPAPTTPAASPAPLSLPRPLRRPGTPTILAILDVAWMRLEADRVGIATTLDGVALTAAELRIALCEANVIPVVLGGDGQILDFGRSRRDATDTQWRALLARDGGCVALGCHAPATWTVAHHCKPWEHGGCTDLSNLCLLCPTHHRELHRHGWTAHVEGGVVRITTAAGHDIPTRNRNGPVPAREPTNRPKAA